MSFDLGSVVAHIKADVSDFKRGINEVKQQAGGLKAVGSTLAGVGRSIFSLGGAIAGVGIGALAFDIAKTRGEAERYRIALDNVIKNTDLTTEKVTEMKGALAEANVVGGQADAVMLAFSRTGLATLQDESGKAKVDFESLLLATKDLSASMGKSSEQGVNTLIESLSTLDTMGLRNIGVVFNQRDAWEAYAKVVGKNANDLTLQEKQLAIINQVMEQGSAVAGTYKDTYDELEKAIGSTKDRLREAKEQLGAFLEPAFTAGVVALRDSFQGLRDWAKANQEQLTSWGEKIAELVPIVVNGLGQAFQFLIDHKEIVIAFFAVMALSVGAFAVALISAHAVAIGIFTGLVALITLLQIAWNQNWLGIQEMTRAVVEFLTELFQNVLIPLFQYLVERFKEQWGIISSTVQLAWALISGIIKTGVAVVMAVLFTFLAILTGRWDLAWNYIKNAASVAWESIKGVFNAGLNFIKNWGGAVFDALTKPFRDAWNTIQDLVNKIRDKMDFTKRHSPSIVDIVNRGVGEVNKAMAGLDFSPVFNSLPTSSDFENAFSGINANSSIINQSNVFNVNNGVDARTLSERLAFDLRNS